MRMNFDEEHGWVFLTKCGVLYQLNLWKEKKKPYCVAVVNGSSSREKNSRVKL